MLSVRDLSTRFFTQEGQVNAVESVSFDVRDNEILGIVGESGSGKSVTALSLIDLVESPGRVTDGEIWYNHPDLADEFRGEDGAQVEGDHVDLRTVPAQVRRALRGPSFGTIFQDPMSSFNPSITVGEQLAEAVEVQRRASANHEANRKIRRIKRIFALHFHPDHVNATGLERDIRETVFKDFWGELDKIEREDLGE